MVIVSFAIHKPFRLMKSPEVIFETVNCPRYMTDRNQKGKHRNGKLAIVKIDATAEISAENVGLKGQANGRHWLF